MAGGSGTRGPTVELNEIRRSHGDGADLARVEWTASVGDDPDGTASQIAALVRDSHNGGRTWRAAGGQTSASVVITVQDVAPGARG